MNLQEMMHSVTEKKEFSQLEKSDKQLIKDILNEGRFNLLLKYLNEKDLFTIGDLKSLTENEIVALKKDIPTLAGVGDEKTPLYLKKINELLNVKYTNVVDNHRNENLVKQYGIIGDPLKWHIEVNHLKFRNNEFVDIRKVGPDGSRSKGISLKMDEVKELIKILSNEFSEKNKPTLIQEQLLFNKIDENIEELEPFGNSLKEICKDSLKNKILDNERHLLEIFHKEFGTTIKLFIKKIESLEKDGDIVKFLNNPSILDIKKEQYDYVHRHGEKTAIDIMNEYNKKNLEFTNISNLSVGDSINTMTICSMANNFNLMLGMYYNEEEDYVLLKSQTSDGQYNNKWINDKKMLYYLQNEKEEKYNSLEFSHLPNQICRDIIMNQNSHTKVYLFDRSSKKEEYTFCGEVKLSNFANDNKCIIIEKI